MADPISLAAGAAGFVGLVDVLFHRGKELCTFISSVKKASKDIQRILGELQQLDAIMVELREGADAFNRSSFATQDGLPASSLMATLQACKQEYDALLVFVKDAETKGQSGAVKKLTSRVGWAWNSKKLALHYEKLREFKISLNTVLSMLGRRNDIMIRGHIQSAQQSIQGASMQSTRQYDALDNHLSTGLSTVQTITQATRGNTLSMQTRMEDSHNQTSAALQRIDNQISQAALTIPQDIQLVRSDIRQTSLAHEAISRQQLESDFRLLQRMDKMQDFIESRFTDLNIGFNEANTQRIVAGASDLGAVVMPLMHMQSNLPSAFAMLTSKPGVVLSDEEIELFQAQMDEVLAASHEAAAISLKRKRHTFEADKSGFTGPGNNKSSLRASSSKDRVPPVKRRRGSKRKWHCATMTTYHGRFCTHILNEPETDDQSFSVASAMFSFYPKPEIQRLGVSLSLTKDLKEAIYPSISQYIRVFNVLGEEDPVWRQLRENNIPELQRLLFTRTITPSDRTQNGMTLLGAAATWVSYEACKLLLQEGASVHECNGESNNILEYVWCLFWYDRLEHKPPTVMEYPKDMNHSIQLSNLAIESGASIEDCSDPIWHLENYLFVIIDHTLTPDTASQFCDFLISTGVGIECRGGHGLTPLLYAAGRNTEGSLQWLQILVAHGADVSATIHGLGPLHFLFVERDRLWMVRAKSKAEILLQAGCDPHATDLEGRTPAYYARRSGHEVLESWRAWLTDLGFEAYGGSEDTYDVDCSTDGDDRYCHECENTPCVCSDTEDKSDVEGEWDTEEDDEASEGDDSGEDVGDDNGDDQAGNVEDEGPSDHVQSR